MAVTIFLDAMGGDLAPMANVRGAIAALQANSKLKIVLTGDQKQLQPLVDRELKKLKTSGLNLTIEHCEEVIAMHSKNPAAEVRSKKQSSLCVAMRLANENPNSAFLSAGNSGAALAAAVLYMKRINGVERPAIATAVPTINGFALIVDAGANISCRPSYLAQFALLGSVYHRRVYPNSKGRFGILSNGTEDSKGTDLTRKAHQILQAVQESGVVSADQYLGYIEGNHVFTKPIEVVVCDGFTGNLILKSLEGLGSAILGILKQEVKKRWLSALGVMLARGAFKAVKQKTDYAEIGSAPLIGINGHAFISHGKSHSRAMKNAVLSAAKAVESDLTKEFTEIIQNTKEFMAIDSDEQ